jgi:HD-like signal output (HDOD) protein
MRLEQWLLRLSEQEMPIFRQTVADVREATEDPEVGADDLARLVVRDPLLSAKLLRSANSVFYNASGKSIQTVSWSVMTLGVDNVRNTCVETPQMEQCLRGPRSREVQAEFARAIHASTLAKALAVAMRHPEVEEIQLAALLRRIGHLAFWCQGDEEAELLAEKMVAGQDNVDLEKTIVGFPVEHLSRSLTEEWKLSSLLMEIFRGRGSSDAARCVIWAWELAHSLSQGWSSRPTIALLERIAERQKIEPDVMAKLVARSTTEARRIGLALGVSACEALLPLPPQVESDDESLFEFLQQNVAEPPAPRLASGDPKVLLANLRKMAEVVRDGQVSQIFGLSLEALTQGVGFDRAVFAVRPPGSDMLQARLVMGVAEGNFQDTFKMESRRQSTDAFTKSMESGELFEFDPFVPGARNPGLPVSMRALLQNTAMMFYPVQAGGRLLGAIYADRGPSGRGLDENAREGFRHVCQNLSQLLGASATRG